MYSVAEAEHLELQAGELRHLVRFETRSDSEYFRIKPKEPTHSSGVTDITHHERTSPCERSKGDMRVQVQ